MKTFRLNADRNFLEVTRGGITTKWEYDVVSLKLAFEELERQHGLRTSDTEVEAPTDAMLTDAAKMLESKGLEGCTIDLAYRIYSLIGVQFQQLAESVAIEARQKVTA